MSEEEKNKWDKRYADRDYVPRQKPADLLVAWLDRLPPGKALDLACGMGRNALFLAEQGYTVTAIDISPAAIAAAKEQARQRGVTIDWIIADLDSYPIEGSFDVILDFFYVKKTLAPMIVSSLKSGGIFICENHVISPTPSEDGPQPRFRFQPGEMLQLFQELKILHYEEGARDDERGRHSWVGRLVAQKA